MASADLTAIIGADTRPLEEALRKAVAKPYKLNFSVDQGASGALGRIRSQLGEFDKSLAASNARVMAFSLSASSMFAVTKSLKEMVRVTVEVERKMTSINSILGAGRSQFKQFGNDLFKIARDTSTSFEEVADAAEELARQGVGIEETLKRTSSAMKLAKVSGVEVKTAVDAITAALNSNNDAWLDSEKLINKLVAVDAKFAVSAGGLAEAIKRVGSVASDAGLDIDDLIAAITSAQQTTARGEAVIGNALKTIFTRAQRPKVLEDFESLGIATKDAVGNIRPLAGVLTDVAKRYDDLSSAQQQSVSELVGGVYQINILKALFRDLGKETSFFGSALKTSKNATNEADRRVAELNETLDSLFKKLTVNLTQVGSGVGNDVFGPLFKNLLKSANAGLEQVSRDMSGESGQFFGKAFEAVFKGIGNTLNSPILIGGFITISRFLLQTAREGREAIKTLAGLNTSLHSLEVVSADAANWLRQNPKYLYDIVVASKSAEGATRALAAATQAYTKFAAERNAVDAKFSEYGGALARGSGLVSIPTRGVEKIQPKKVPNFAPLSSAIARESFSVNPALIRVGSHSALRGPGNPDGVGVYNLRDEPLGLGQGIERARAMGLNPKTHGIPNYADGRVRQWLGRQKEAYMGGEGSPDPGNKFMYAMGASMAGPMISTMAGGGRTSKIAEEATNALSLYFTLSTFLRGPKGGKVAIGAAAISGIFGAAKQFTNSFNTLDTEIQVLKDNIQKASGGLNKYATTLEQLQESYLNNNVSAEKIGKLQNKLAESLSQLPAELRGQLIGAKSGGQVQEIVGRYTESQDAKLREKEFAMGLSSLLNEQSILRRGSLLGLGEAGTKTGKEKLDAIADSLLGSLSESGLKKIGGAAGLGSGGLLSVLGAAGLGGSTLTQLARVNPDELKAIQARMVGEQGSRESDVQKFKALAPQRQREIEQAQMLEKRMKGARDVIRQTFEQIGQFANIRATMMGRRGIMNAAGIGEQIQGVAGLIGETGSPTQAAMANYKAQIAANQIQAASGISNVFGGLRGGISTLFSNTDLTRMGDIPARMRAGQGSLMNILSGSSVSGIGEGAISLFKSLGKDDDTAEIKKLMADSNEKLVEIYQTLEEQNKLAEIQKNIALQRAEFERTLKVGGGLGSFMDRGVKMQQLTDIYSGKFGVQTGIFKGQGSIDLLKSFLGAGGQAGAPGFSKLLGVATEARAQDIISSQKDLNRAFQGTGLSLGVPSLADARKVAETQIAAELKTGDSAMEKQMAQLQAALANTLSSSMGGQFNNAAQVFANVLAGSSTFIELNSTINSTQEVLKTLDATLKSLQGGAGYGVRAGGNIPISAAATEKMMAKAGGYNPGYIRRTGNLIYNSAERVDYLPGVREPIISPPPGSLAGFLHRQNLNAAFGFAAVGGPSMGNMDPKLAAFWANYSVDAKTGTYRNKKTGKFISHREANELMGRKIFYMPDAPVQTTPPGQQWKAKRQSIAGPFNLPEKGSLIPFSISEMSAKASQSSGMTMPTISYNQGIKASGLPISSAQFISPLISPTVGSSLRLSPNVDFTSGTGKPITVSPQAPSLVTQAIATSARAAKAGYPVTDFADIDDYYNRAFANQYLDPIGPQQPPSKMIRGGYRPPTSNYFQFLKEAKTNMGGLRAALKSQVSYKGIMGGLKGAFGPASLALSVADVGSDFLNPRMIDRVGGSKRFKMFGTDYSQVGEKYLGEQYGMIDNFENMSTFAAPGKGSLYGTAFGMVTDPIALAKHFELQSSVFDLMESEGDVAVSQKRLALSQAKKLEARAKKGDKMAAAQLKVVRGDIAGDYQTRRSGVMEMVNLNAKTPNEQSFVPGRVTYSNIAQLNEAYHARNKSTLADKTLAVERATSKYETPLEKIGSLRSNLKAMSAGHAWRPAFEEDLKNRSVQYNADIIAKMFGINDPKQLQRLQVGVRGAMESGNLQGYVKSLGKPVAQPAGQVQESQKQPAGNKSEISVNVTMGGNLGVKNTNIEFSEEQYQVINSIVAEVAKGIEEKIKAIVERQPAEVRASVAAATPSPAVPDAGGPGFFM